MAKMMMLQQSQPSFYLLTSSLSDFNSAKLHLQVQQNCLLSYKKNIGVTLFTRGKSPIAPKQLPGESDQDFADFSSKILHLKGDSKDYDFGKSSLSAEGYDVVYDINGREAEEVEPIIGALPKLEQYIYCSSAGVYLKSNILPHREVDAVDQKSRHKGNLETESLLQSKGVNWTSIRSVYIYGPLNYNPVEEWFFHRLKAGRPIPVPNSGIQISQLTQTQHLSFLSDHSSVVMICNIKWFCEFRTWQQPFSPCLATRKPAKRYSTSQERSMSVTFDGLARACAEAGGFPEPEIVHYNPKKFDFGKKKAFPFRDQHFFASVEKAKHVLGWKPEFDLVEGLTDSYNLDFGRGTFRKEGDFTTDGMVLSKKLVPPS
ncbi:hypothetical protein Rs2_45281 [Raphanus sativus]|nr:hypothetical protein Rs2_45281 [Raphanus sativus]